MDSMLISSVGAMAGVSLVMASVIAVVARKFRVDVDHRVEVVFDMLPAANCGGCGAPGCKAFANRVVQNAVDKKDISDLSCPVGGAELMEKVARYLNLEVTVKAKTVAVVRCNGSCEHSPDHLTYDGPKNCAVAHALYSGAGGCATGCLGCGDCVVVCPFDAIHMNDSTGLPEVIENSCVSCRKCVIACPRNIIEIRPAGERSRRVFVSCVNTEKGAAAKKNCSVACIGCSLCVKACGDEAITVTNNLAYIDAHKCTNCTKCVTVCPTKAIQATFEVSAS